MYRPGFVADNAFLSQSYDSYGSIEEQFQEALAASLNPRGPAMLYELLEQLTLPTGATVLDVGCGEGWDAVELAKRLGANVLGIDPVPRHMQLAAEELAQQAQDLPTLADAVRFELGTAEALPAEDASVDLLWCRDVLTHVDDSTLVYAEFRRVLKPGGRAVIYQMFTTDRLEPAEAAWLLPTMGCVAASMRPELTDAAIAQAGLSVDECIVLGTEWGEYSQENSGKPGRNLLHAARLLHEPERYVQQFGQANYDIALGDCLWHIYRMIGKLSDRVYVLSAPAQA